MPEGTTILPTHEQLAGVRYDSNGLDAAIAQDVDNGDVLMLCLLYTSDAADDLLQV